MSTMTSASEVLSNNPERPWSSGATAVEILLVYAGILLYIWRWQSTHPRAWMALLAAVLLSHLAHRDTPRALGLTSSSMRASAQVVFPLAVSIYLPPIIYGLARHRLLFTWPEKQAVISFLGYGVWCAFQQYLAQSYFHRRLRNIIPSPHLSSALVGLMFGAAHIPNPILMVVTALGGFLLAEVYARHRNIWPLALAQAVGGFLLAALLPDPLLHHMRVGPGYFFYQLR
jgi:membrane protease YdiL (CAAX protease family)